MDQIEIRLRYFERIISDTLKNKIGWEIVIPVKLIKKTNKIATITFPQQKNNKIIKTTSSSFVPNKIPLKISINEELLFFHDDKFAKNIILHEINHWITYEKYGYDKKPHGKEFKIMGRILGLHEDFVGATVDTSKYGFSTNVEYHIGLCSSCKKIIIMYTREETLKKKCNNFNYVSKCCRSTIVYGGTKKNKKRS